MNSLEWIRRPGRQHGQVMPVILFGLLLGAGVLVMTFNTGQLATEKTRVVNAADAAAYSGAVWTARHLNFMAYTNRAMIANHVGVGHLVSYMSWIRYVDESADKIEDYARWIPYVAQAAAYAESVADYYRQITEMTLEGAVPALDGLNATYHGAQVATYANLVTPTRLQDLMAQTAAGYDRNIRVNNPSDVSALPPALAARATALVGGQAIKIPSFIGQFSAGNDNGEMKSVVEQSYGDSTDWIKGNRGWGLTVPMVIRFGKTGATGHEMSSTLTDWEADDSFEVSRWRMSKMKWRSWRNVAKGEATATEFKSNYQGVPGYYELADSTASDHSLLITAVATNRTSDVGVHQLMGMEEGRHQVTAVATAEVRHLRPSGSGFRALSSGKKEYANLFNPFWEAALVDKFVTPGT